MSEIETFDDSFADKTITALTMETTVFDSLLASLRHAADYNRDDVERPAAIVWPDEKGEWERLLPRLRLAMPHLLTFGPYDPTTRTGPAIWLHCVLAGKVPELAFPPDVIPIVYLPGVSRPPCAADECPPELRPLAELQYRGVFWSQHNGKDWTVSAFLQAEKGGLKPPARRDTATQDAIRRSIEKLADIPVVELQAKSANGSLDSDYFNTLLSTIQSMTCSGWPIQRKRARAGNRSRGGGRLYEAFVRKITPLTPTGTANSKARSYLDCTEAGLEERLEAVCYFPWSLRGNRGPTPQGKAETQGGRPAGKSGGGIRPQDNEAEEASLRRWLHCLDGSPLRCRDGATRFDDLHQRRGSGSGPSSGRHHWRGPSGI